MTTTATPSEPSAPSTTRRGLRAAARSAAAAAFAVTILALALLIAACGAQVEGGVAVQGPPDQAVVVQDEYDYYPSYGVYYNPYRRMCYYPENGVWVERPSPPGISVDVLLASPHVHGGFHDHPRYHHEDMVRRYPRTWSEHRPAGGHEEHEERR